MHDLIPLPDIAAGSLPTLGALTEAEVERVLGYAEASKAAESLRAYRIDFHDFTGWCAAAEHDATPSTASNNLRLHLDGSRIRGARRPPSAAASPPSPTSTASRPQAEPDRR